ncbi:hypothetical protein FGRMN_3778 [Fusarium graminum]|nr:hypothetical protein FGRMN_3778 [Fusarium graminum]
MSPSRQDVYKAHLGSTDKPLRPIFTNLNGDNSWLMSFPRPKADQASSGKAYFHIVFEPWLKGDVSLFRAWIFNIALDATATATDAQSVEGIILEIEDAAASCIPLSQIVAPTKNGPYHGNIDAIMLTFHYLDHIHEATLRTFDENIPVIATPEAAAIVQPWNHFKTVSLSRDLDVSAKTWRSPELHPEYLPDWLTVFRLPGHATLNFCTALIWTHETEPGQEVHETILSSPHGMCLDQAPLDAFLNAEPKTEMLTLFHGLKENYAIVGQTTYGAKGGLALYRKIGGTKNWITTHDSHMTYSGLLLYLTQTNDVPRSLEWALEAERERGEGLEADVPNLYQVPNGGAVVLQ